MFTNELRIIKLLSEGIVAEELINIVTKKYKNKGDT